MHLRNDPHPRPTSSPPPAPAAPSSPSTTARAAASELPAHIDHPSGYLALSPRNLRFTVPDLPGFIAYREHGRTWFLFGGVHAPGPLRGALLDRFLQAAGNKRCGVIGVQVRLDQAALFRDRGFTTNCFGQSYGLRLDRFKLSGTARMKLRNKIKRARALGLRVCELGRELPRDAAMFARLDAISDGWLRNKGKKELDFMIGELGGPQEELRRVFVALDPQDRALGFITYVPAYGERPGYLHDLTRRAEDAPPGTMELINAEAMARLAAEGATYLHFGFTPFVFDADEPAGHSPVLRAVFRLLARYGRFVYPAQSQVDYKRKWGPELVEPELLVCRPLSLRGLIDLLLVTRSL
ncbi:MAG: DUF2156 domain-containing protein [Polyangia bacterium]